MKTRIFPIVIMLFIFSTFLFAQDDKGEMPDKEKNEQELKKNREETSRICELLKEIFEKFRKALEEHNFKDILKLYDLSDEDVKKEATEYYTKLCNDKNCQYKDFEIIAIGSGVDSAVIKYKYMRKSNDNAETKWEKKENGHLEFSKTNNEWKIIFITLKDKWEEAKSKLKEIENAICVYKLDNDGDLSKLLNEDWIKVSEILADIMLWKETLKKMRFFDEDDFAIKLKEGSTTEFILKCDASRRKDRGYLKQGPQQGSIRYDSETKKWTEDFKPEKKEDDKKEKEEKPKIKPKTDNDE